MKKNAQLRCWRCEGELTEGKARCRSCGAWHLAPESRTLGGEAPGQSGDGTKLLSEVRAEPIPRLITGHTWDDMFGGGIVLSSVNLVGGKPGAGKTTFFFQLLDSICELTGRETMFVAAEQKDTEIQLNTRRVGIKHESRIRLVDALSGNVNIAGAFAEYKPAAIVIDSIQGLIGEDDSESINVCKICKEHACALNAPVFIVSQVNKDEDFAGLMKMQHVVDSLFLLGPIDEESDIRELSSKKNRFGRAFISRYYQMTETGLVELPSDWTPDELDELDEEDEENDDS